MKGKNHFLLTFATMVFFVFWIYRLILNEEYNYVILGFAFVSVAIGSILPDADIEDGKSRIFCGIFFPIAVIVRLFEYPLAFALKKQAKHRGVLHHPIGILFSSVIVILFLSILLYFLGLLSFMVIVYLYLIIVFSQHLHILEYAFRDYFIYFVIAIGLIIFLAIRFGNVF